MRWPQLEVARRWLVGERGAAGVAVGARLGSALFLVQGFTAAGTAWVFPEQRVSLLAFAATTLAIGLVVRSLPWTRWPRPALFALPVVALSTLAVTGVSTSGILPAYLAFFTLSFVYVGLTQPPGWGIALMPVAFVCYAVASHGGRGGTVVAATTGAVALVIAELLAAVMVRAHETEDGFARVLEAARAMAKTDSVEEACDTLVRSAVDVFGADKAVVYLADPTQAYRYVSVAAAGIGWARGAHGIDIADEQTGIGVVVRTGERLFLPDAVTSPVASRRLVADLGAASVCFLPLNGRQGAVGALVVSWSRRKSVLDPVAATAAEVLSAEAGWVLERLGITARLAWEAENDALTCLPNRRALNRALSAAKPGDALVILDLDHFKQVNDSYGHAAGDETLRLMADCLRVVTREGDCSARMGGEEFAIVLRKAGVEGAESVVRRLREAWSRREPLTSFSAGIAVFRAGEGSVTTLGRADAALYAAKDAGRDCVRVG
jgi:diguanylate cyclase (GGDEF)-like protein